MSEQEAQPISIGQKQEFVKMHPPEGCTSISVAGQTFDVPPGSSVSVPSDIATELRSHGFTDTAPVKKEVDALAGLSQEERELLTAHREAKAAEAAGTGDDDSIKPRGAKK